MKSYDIICGYKSRNKHLKVAHATFVRMANATRKVFNFKILMLFSYIDY